jgi:hypothetical protein
MKFAQEFLIPGIFVTLMSLANCTTDADSSSNPDSGTALSADATTNPDFRTDIPVQVVYESGESVDAESVFFAIDDTSSINFAESASARGLTEEEIAQQIHVVQREYMSDGLTWRAGRIIDLSAGSSGQYALIEKVRDELRAERDVGVNLVPGQLGYLTGDTDGVCRSRCLVRVWYAPIWVADTRVTELLWDESPDRWMYAEMQYSDTERNELTQLREHNLDSGRGVVDAGMLTLVVGADALRLEYRTRALDVDIQVWPESLESDAE